MVYPEKFSKAGPLWGTNSRDDDMCQIDDANDFAIGTSEHLNPMLLSDDFNKIVDEKSLIKKYQREISSLKQELDQLRRGMLAGISHEEIMSLRQQVALTWSL
ncbi:hypothetical protein Ancab_021482 [Ancistrocladus abbreviatus]